MENDVLLKLKNSESNRAQAANDRGLTGADGLRAIACLSVMTHHFTQRININSQPPVIRDVSCFFLLGNVGVSIFFVLSGFLLSYPFWRQYLNEGNFPNIKQYAIRRAARIMPGYYLAFIVSLLLVIILQTPTEAIVIRSIAGLAFTSGFHYVTFFPNQLNSPFWSISFEVFCYFLMPLFMYGLFKIFGTNRSFLKSILYWIGVLGIIIGLNQLIHIYLEPDNVNRGWQYGPIGGAKYWMPNYNPIGFFGHFTMGIFAAGASVRLFMKADKLEKFKKVNGFDMIGLSCFLCSIVMLWFMRYAPDFSLSLQNQPYYFPIYTILIAAALAVAPNSNWFGRILDNRFFRYTAKVSFGLYLWHYLIISLTCINIYFDNLLVWGGVSIAITVLSYIIATLSYKYVEKPVLDRVHRKYAR